MAISDSKINIGSIWKVLDSIKINIGDAWKDVVEVKINIGDSWKTVFSAGFVPSGSPIGWWPADGIIGLEDGNPVDTWPDQSGNGDDLTQNIAERKPTYKTNIQNGLPTVRFNGIYNCMNTIDMGMTQPETIFIVLKQVSYAHPDFIFDGTNAADMQFYQNTTSPNLTMFAGAAGPTTDKVLIGSFFVVTTLWKGASSVIRVNGANEVSGNVGAGNAGGLWLAAYSAPDYQSEIDVCELIAYDGEESFEANEAGLMTKYGL